MDEEMTLTGSIARGLNPRRFSNEKGKSAIGVRGIKTFLASGDAKFSLAIKIESPPLVLHGRPQDSTGALLSGILELTPIVPPSNPDGTYEVEKLEMKLVMETETQYPLAAHCEACKRQTKLLNTWTFIPSRRKFTFRGGRPQGFPFSFLLPGDLPATTRSSLGSISYKLIVEAIPPTPIVTAQRAANVANVSRPVILISPLNLQRAIRPPEEPKHSQRVFPPTTIVARVTLPTILHPGSTDNAIDISFSGLNGKDSRLRWSLRRIVWKLDEISQVISVACPLHSTKNQATEHQDSRIIGSGVVVSGWKRDLQEGKVDCVVYVGSSPLAAAACDVDAINTTELHVSHQLVIECVVAEEVLHTMLNSARGGGVFQATGNARVLRMTYPVTVTDRGGMGISWDEEIPPRYEDVAWNAPPTFDQSESSAYASRHGFEGIEALEGVRRRRRPGTAGSNGSGESGGSESSILSRTNSESSV
jgi:arrestin-related trafficking adapter 1